MTTTEALMHFETKTQDGISRTRCFDANREELAGSLNFAESAWRSNPKKCIAAAALPLVHIPAALDAMPADLLNLPDDAQIVARSEIARYDTVEKAGKVRAEVADAIERHKHGLYTAREIAHLSYKSASASSRTYSGDSESEYQEMASAFKSGRLIAFKRTGKLLRDSEIRQFPGVLSQSSAALNAMNDCWFKLDDVNAWLESERATWRLQSPSAPSASAPAVAAPEPVAPPAEAAPRVAAWTFTSSEREKGYGADLNALLERLHKSGKPIPTAAEVIEIWKANPPRIFRVVGGNLEYRPESGGIWKGVQEKSLNEAIKKRTSA